MLSLFRYQTLMHHKQMPIPLSPPIPTLKVSNNKMPDIITDNALTTTAEAQFSLLLCVSDHGCVPVSLSVSGMLCSPTAESLHHFVVM